MSTQGGFPLGLTGLISVQSKGLSRVFSNTIIRNFHLAVTSGAALHSILQTILYLSDRFSLILLFCVVCSILVPRSGIKPVPSAMQV